VQHKARGRALLKRADKELAEDEQTAHCSLLPLLQPPEKLKT
jgi:hypothetical protein